MHRIKDIFRADSTYRPLLLSILISGLAYGLYKGMLDNFLAAALVGVSAVFSFRISGSSQTDATKRRFYFHRRIHQPCHYHFHCPVRRMDLGGAGH